MKNFFHFLAIAAICSGCTTVSNQARIHAGFKASEFNRLSSSYMQRPTFAAYQELSDGAKVLRIEMSMYGGKMSSIPLDINRANQYIEAIDKYLEWESIAMKRGDAITKRIATVPTWGNMIQGDARFTFYSGNRSNHYLALTFCAAGTCMEDVEQMYDRSAAEGLKLLLSNVSSGGAAAVNREADYR